MNEVRVNIAGAEMELRPISARQYLAARKEAEKLAENMGEDKISKALVLGAALLSRGLFYDGQRIFADGNEVLDAFSADEIVSTALFMDLEADKQIQIVETAERISKIGRENEPSVSYDTMSVMNFDNHAVNTDKGSMAYGDTVLRVNSMTELRSYSPRSDMRRVSDFFQRDSRRYDGIISSY